MKTYKTWEVIKMLSENPKLKFRTNCSDAFKGEDGYIVFENTDCVDGFCGNFKGNEEWILVKEPVDFMTAVQSGKRMKVEHERMDTFSCLDEYESLATILGVLTDNYCGKTIRLILTEGKFYIEE